MQKTHILLSQTRCDRRDHTRSWPLQRNSLKQSDMQSNPHNQVALLFVWWLYGLPKKPTQLRGSRCTSNHAYIILAQKSTFLAPTIYWCVIVVLIFIIIISQHHLSLNSKYKREPTSRRNNRHCRQLTAPHFMARSSKHKTNVSSQIRARRFVKFANHTRGYVCDCVSVARDKVHTLTTHICKRLKHICDCRGSARKPLCTYMPYDDDDGEDDINHKQYCVAPSRLNNKYKPPTHIQTRTLYLYIQSAFSTSAAAAWW